MMGPTVLLCTLAAVAVGFLGVLIYYKKPFVKGAISLPVNKGVTPSTATKVVPLSSDSPATSVVE
jgi:hypothetical protein